MISANESVSLPNDTPSAILLINIVDADTLVGRLMMTIIRFYLLFLWCVKVLMVIFICGFLVRYGARVICQKMYWLLVAFLYSSINLDNPIYRGICDSIPGMVEFVSNDRCKRYTVRETICWPDVDVLCTSFYLPREFGSVVICAVYVPFTFMYGMQQEQKLILQGFEQRETWYNKTLDKCYKNIKMLMLPDLTMATTSSTKFPHKTMLKCSKPQIKMVTVWSENDRKTERLVPVHKLGIF